MEKLLTVKQLSDYLQVSNSLIYKWIHCGYIPHIKIGTRVRFRIDDVDKWLHRRKVRGRLKQQVDIEL